MILTQWPCPNGQGKPAPEFALSFEPNSPTASGKTAPAPRLLILPALFDEANRLRRFSAELMRRLAARGIASVLPDLPGMGESLAPLESQSLESWRIAAAAAASHFAASHVLTIRAAACLAPPDLPGWHYAPLAPASQLRQMLRARVLSRREAGVEETSEALLAHGLAQGLTLSGYRLGAAMLAGLSAPSAPSSLPAISQSDLAQGGASPAGLWLRAEPGEDPAQAQALAAILASGISPAKAAQP